MTKSSTLKAKSATKKPTSAKKAEKEFKKLQNQWYKKLAKSGFEDIEWHDAKTGKGQNSSYLVNNPIIQSESHYNSKLDHYRLAKNFHTHYKFATEVERFMFGLYADGATYDQIGEQFHAKYGAAQHHPTKRNKYRNITALDGTWFHSENRTYNLITKKAAKLFIDHMLTVCYAWNATSSEGIKLDAAEPHVTEVLINEPDTEFAD